MSDRSVISQSKIMDEARRDLSGNWGLAIGFTCIFILLSLAMLIFPLSPLIFSGPLSLGVVFFYLNISRNKYAEIGNIFEGFNNFGDALLAYIVYFISIFFGFILFIIPGIFLALAWSQTFYILHDNPGISATDALKKSWDMMDGFKWDYFLLALIFVLLFILSSFTFYIALLWLIPFMQMSYAKFYERIKYVNFPEDEPGHEDDYADHLLDF